MLKKSSNSVLRSILAVLLCVSMGGCAVPIILAVGAGAVGGYAVSRDTFEGVTTKGPDEIWDAANRVASIMGTIDFTDRKTSEITAHINGARVTINVISISLTTTKLRIKARKGIFPAVGTAQEVYSKIMNQLEDSGK